MMIPNGLIDETTCAGITQLPMLRSVCEAAKW